MAKITREEYSKKYKELGCDPAKTIAFFAKSKICEAKEVDGFNSLNAINAVLDHMIKAGEESIDLSLLECTGEDCVVESTPV